MQPLNITETINAISMPRLSSYRSMFAPTTDLELYGIYCWNEALSSAFGMILSTVEVTLRNAFHRELSKRFGPMPGAISSDWYDSLDLSTKSKSKITEIKGQRRWKYQTISPNDVVAGLTFGFWKHLLDVKKDATGAPVSINDLLAGLLPNHPNSSAAYWSMQKRQDAIYSRFDLVGDMRNRIAHHEPIWKFGALKEERRVRHGYKPPDVKLKPKNDVEVLERLNLVYNRTFELLHWLSAHRALDHKSSGNHYKIRYLLSADGLEQFRSFAATKEMTLLGMRKMMKTRSPLNGIIHVKHVGEYAAVVLPWTTF